jgi:CspA family cold shock protein
VIKWFSNAKGFGFIENSKGSKDIFVHYSSIVSEGYRTLKSGQLVNYEMKQDEKGLHAENVIPIGRKKRRSKQF